MNSARGKAVPMAAMATFHFLSVCIYESGWPVLTLTVWLSYQQRTHYRQVDTGPRI